MPDFPRFAEVVLDVGIFGALTYEIPDELRGRLEVGHLVQAPFRHRSKTGLVVGLTDAVAEELEGKVRPLLDRVERTPLLDPAGIAFLEFIADYYLTPLGEVLKLALPPAVRLEGAKHYTLVSDAQPLPGHLEPALALLQPGEATSVAALREHSGLTYTVLQELEEQQAVSVSYEETEKVRAKQERFYSATEKVPERALGAKQAAILTWIQQNAEPVALTELRQRFDSPHGALRSLEERGLLAMAQEEVYRDPFRDEPVAAPGDHPLTQAQQHAVDTICSSAGFSVHLLHGVTGSGKTRVYAEVIRRTLEAGRTAMVLLPEISLTPQFVSVFRGYFGDRIAVLHSGLSVGERFDQWRQIRRGEVDIVIGARSALFAPLTNLGAIVVDEEHDPSFKQEDGPRYNARDMAVVRGKLEGAVVVLGSATPSLESFANARSGRYTHIVMAERIGERPMPAVSLVDMRGRVEATSRSDVLSEELLRAIDASVEAGEQAILFLNRRGFSLCIVCDVCGHIWECPNCDVSLTYHRRQESLRCHHCDHSLRLPETCPECANQRVGTRGVGTEQLEAHLHALYPQRSVARLDRDTSRGNRLRKVIRKFAAREIDLLVGTQMVTKGHDFPGVTTVGVVQADGGLNFPDFRGAERTFQLLTQVAGRAGRGDVPGSVFVQTYDPDHFALIAASNHDFETFADDELERRQLFGYPPFGYLIAVKFEGTRDNEVKAVARSYASAGRRRLRTGGDLGDCRINGPAPSPLERLRGRARWQLLFQGTSRGHLRTLVQGVLADVRHFEPAARSSTVRVIVDVDPLNML